jgi:hypothetical protein
MLQALLLMPLFLAQAAGETPPPGGAKPQVRNVQLSSGQLQFNIKLEPGAPDAGRVVDVRVELAMVPPVPDPIYGERIPVKGARLVASLADQEGTGYRSLYLVHPLSDAGLYGFHFTPLRSDVYVMELTARYQERDYQVSCKVPVGIWPFPPGTETVQAESAPSAMRMPAIPGSLGPSVSATTAPSAGHQKSAFQQGMFSLGAAFAGLANALLAGRADFSRAGEELSAMQKALGSLNLPETSPLKQLVEELAARLKAFDQAGGAQALRRLAESCNSCHLAKRWKLFAEP